MFYKFIDTLSTFHNQNLQHLKECYGTVLFCLSDTNGGTVVFRMYLESLSKHISYAYLPLNISTSLLVSGNVLMPPEVQQ